MSFIRIPAGIAINCNVCVNHAVSCETEKEAIQWALDDEYEQQEDGTWLCPWCLGKMTEEDDPLPVAKAQWGFKNAIIATCPYCGELHRHLWAGKGNSLVRMADCFRGEYRMEIQEEKCT